MNSTNDAGANAGPLDLGAWRNAFATSRLPEDARIYVAGHTGLVGSALVRRLRKDGHDRLITRSHQELDLMDQRAVLEFFAAERPQFVFLAAAKVGGIRANSIYPADFIHANLAIQTNVIHAAYLANVERLLFLGSSCIYPRACPQPIKEEYLLSGPLEPTNRAYAVAKIAGLEMCAAYNRQHGTSYLAVMPTNLYGPGDNFDLQNAHVLPALVRRMHEARAQDSREVVVWGSGTPRREFLYSEDMADACVRLMGAPEPLFRRLIEGGDAIINIGSGVDITIREAAEIIAEVVGFRGEIVFDTNMPDGTPRKLLDISRLTTLGWRPQVSLSEGIACTYKWFLNNCANNRHTAARPG